MTRSRCEPRNNQPVGEGAGIALCDFTDCHKTGNFWASQSLGCPGLLESSTQWPQLSYPVTLLLQHLAKDLRAHALFRSAQRGSRFSREGKVSLTAQQPTQQPMIKQESRKQGCARPDRDKASEPYSPPVPVLLLKEQKGPDF